MSEVSATSAGRAETWPKVNSARLLRERHQRAMNRPDFAAYCGFSERRVAAWETGPSRIHPSSLDRLAKRLEIEPRDLLLESIPPQLITGTSHLVQCNIEIVMNAREFVYVTGSRSRDLEYLNAILTALDQQPSLVHRRILFGAPRTQQMREHVLELLALKKSRPEYVAGSQPIGLAIYESDRSFPPEASICMNERRALFVLPSVCSPWEYDTAIVFETNAVIEGWKRWIDSIFNSCSQIKRPSDVPPVRESSND